MVLLLCTAALSAEPVRDHDLVDEDLFSLHWPGSPAFSPDGRRVAYAVSRWDEATDRRRSSLWVHDLASDENRRLTFDDTSDGAPTWSPDGEWLYFRSGRRAAGADAAPGDGSSQVWRMPAEGGAAQPVTSSKGGAHAYQLGAEGRYLYYLRTQDRTDDDRFSELRGAWADVDYAHGSGQRTELHRLDLETWRDRVLFDQERVIVDYAAAPDGSRVALVTQPDSALLWGEGWSQLEILHVATGALEALEDTLWREQAPSPYGWLGGPVWSSDSGALAFHVDFDGHPTEVLLAEFDGSGPTDLWQLDRGGELSPLGLAWRPGSRDLCLGNQDHARQRVECIADVTGGDQGSRDVLTPGDRVVWDFAFSPDGRSLAFVSQDPGHFGEVWLRDKRGRLRPLSDVNPHTATWKLPQLSLVSWTAPDGTVVEGVLELPPGHGPDDGPLPTLVQLHGGPTWAELLGLRLSYRGHGLYAARGWAVFHPNYRGSTGYGDEFLVALVGRENDVEVSDILSGVDHLVAQGIADPDQLAVMGWSNGGYLTNCVITRTDRFKAASSGAGVFDQTMQWAIEDTPGHVINYMQGLPWEVPDEHLAASPLFAAGAIQTPTVIHVGEHDPRVPVQHSRALYRALRIYLDVPVELLVYPDQGHGLGTKTFQAAKMAWDRAWLDHYVLGIEPGEGEAGDGAPGGDRALE